MYIPPQEHSPFPNQRVGIQGVLHLAGMVLPSLPAQLYPSHQFLLPKCFHPHEVHWWGHAGMKDKK